MKFYGNIIGNTMRVRHLDELIKKNPVNRGLDYAFVDSLMRDVVRKHCPEIETIVSLRHRNYKKRVGKRNSAFIYDYVVRGLKHDGTPVVKNLIYSSHSDGSRLRAYLTLNALIKAGFNHDRFKIMEPLDYIPEVQALLYERVRGKTFLYYMERKTPIHDLMPLLNRTALWLYKFHHFPLPEKNTHDIPRFHPSHMNLTTDELLAALEPENPEQAKKLSAFLATLFPIEKKLSSKAKQGLVYGDLHPENIVTDRLKMSGLTMIDFSDVSWGDQLRDCGSFIQQIRFMGRNLYSPEDILALQTTFLESYFQKPLDWLTTNEFERLNLYQAWNSLRGFMYFFFQPKSREESYGLLEDAWLYLTLTREKKKTIVIAV